LAKNGENFTCLQIKKRRDLRPALDKKGNAQTTLGVNDGRLRLGQRDRKKRGENHALKKDPFLRGEEGEKFRRPDGGKEKDKFVKGKPKRTNFC